MEEPVPKDPRGTIESILADSEFMAKDHEFTKRFAQTNEYQDVYENKVASSLIASTMIGNLYTASLYLGFRSCLEFEFQKGIDLNHSVNVLSSIGLLGFLCTGLAYMSFVVLIKRTSPVRASTVVLIVPLTGMMWANIFLNETITSTKLVGCFLILVGVGLVNFFKEEEAET